MASDPEFRGIPNDYRFYRPLDPTRGEFRLVLVEPGEWDDAISCVLVYGSLSALSFTKTMNRRAKIVWEDWKKRRWAKERDSATEEQEVVDSEEKRSENDAAKRKAPPEAGVGELNPSEEAIVAPVESTQSRDAGYQARPRHEERLVRRFREELRGQFKSWKSYLEKEGDTKDDWEMWTAMFQYDARMRAEGKEPDWAEMRLGEPLWRVKPYTVKNAMDELLPPSYECLSYCWGSLNKTKTINLRHVLRNSELAILADQSFNVTENLEVALRNLRRKTSPRLMWIDAICIRQDDPDERAHQVALMGEIYSLAAVVTVWLGEGDHSSDVTLEIAEAFLKIRKAGRLRNGHEALIEGLTSLVRKAGIKGIDEDTPSLTLLNHVHSFFSRPWFTRVWVIQEVFHGPNVSVRCGNYVASWPVVIGAELLLSMGRTAVERWNVLKDTQADVPRIWTRFLIPEDRKFENISALILDTTAFGATDPRDRLYALYSISAEAHNVRNLPEEVRPDYRKTAHEIFANFARWIIRETQSLDILIFSGARWSTQGNVKEPGMESWVPYLSSDEPFDRLTEIYDIKAPGACLTEYSRKSVLGLRGIRVDSVDFICAAKVTPTMTDFAIYLEFANEDTARPPYGLWLLWLFVRYAIAKRLPLNIYNGLDKLIEDINPLLDDESVSILEVPLYPSGGDFLEAFYFTLLCNYPPGGENPPWQSNANVPVSESHRFPKATNTENITLASGFASSWTEGNSTTYRYLPPSYSAPLKEIAANEARGQFTMAVYRSCINRYLFTTVEGYIGLCPTNTQPGDIVAFLYGGKMPFILRQKDSGGGGLARPPFEFIGECVVYGYMEPGIVDTFRLRHYPEEDFGLC